MGCLETWLKTARSITGIREMLTDDKQVCVYFSIFICSFVHSFVSCPLIIIFEIPQTVSDKAGSFNITPYKCRKQFF